MASQIVDLVVLAPDWASASAFKKTGKFSTGLLEILTVLTLDPLELAKSFHLCLLRPLTPELSLAMWKWKSYPYSWLHETIFLHGSPSEAL